MLNAQKPIKWAEEINYFHSISLSIEIKIMCSNGILKNLQQYINNRLGIAKNQESCKCTEKVAYIEAEISNAFLMGLLRFSLKWDENLVEFNVFRKKTVFC